MVAAPIPTTSLPTATALDGTEIVAIVQGGTDKRTTLQRAAGLAGGQISCIEYIIDGGTLPITTGSKLPGLEIPFSCAINRVTLASDLSGTITVDIWKCTYAQYDAGATHPTSGDSITGSSTPRINASTKYQSSQLSGWTTSLTAGDILSFNVSSASGITRALVSLQVTRSLT